MFSQEHLTLRLVRLKPSEKWVFKANGLSFVFMKGGGGQHISKAATSRLASGDVLVLNGAPEKKGRLVADEGSEMVFGLFAVIFEHLFPLFASNEIWLLQNIAEIFKGTRRYGASSPVAQESHRLLAEVSPQFNLAHRSQLLRVAAAVFSEEFKNTEPHRAGTARAEEHLIQVFKELSAKDLMGLSVGKLAARFGCSKRHLNRQFHQHFGFSVAAMKMEMRLLKAATLLRDPEIKVINVAEQCGFNHLGLFNTYFKRRFGTSPGRWRKMSTQSGGQSVPSVNKSLVCPLRSNGFCPWIPDESLGDKTAASHPKIAGIAGQQTGVRASGY